MSDASKREEKQKWAIEKPKLENARRLRGICFIEPDGDEFKRTMKNARRKLEIPMPAAMPCESLRFGAQFCSYASSNEDTRSKSSSGLRMGET